MSDSTGAMGLAKAIREAGSQRRLARLLGISAQAVGRWQQVPVRQIIAVEKATGVPREELRPDLFRRSVRRPPATHLATEGPRPIGEVIRPIVDNVLRRRKPS